jgi:hypothetical protein
VAEEQVAGAGVAEEDDGEEDEKVDEVHEGVADGAGDERHLGLEVEDLEDAQDEEYDCGSFINGSKKLKNTTTMKKSMGHCRWYNKSVENELF